jgi:putative ABC transport system permease protein
VTPLLWRALLRHPLRHPWQLGLAILGIALGVASGAGSGFSQRQRPPQFRSGDEPDHRPRHPSHCRRRKAFLKRCMSDCGSNAASGHIGPVVTGYLPRADLRGNCCKFSALIRSRKRRFAILPLIFPAATFDLRALLLNPDAALLPRPWAIK